MKDKDFMFRNEWEMNTFDCVVNNNEYQLPTRIDGWTVFDLGAHCGYFAYMCYIRGAAAVFSVEGDFSNYELCKKHTDMMEGKVTLYNRTLWDKKDAHLVMINDVREENSGGRRVEEAPKVGLEDWAKDQGIDFHRMVDLIAEPITIEELVQETKVDHIDFMKFDIEGAERQVLRTMSTDIFEMTDRIVVEWHSDEAEKITKELLTQHGFILEDSAWSEDDVFGHVGYYYAHSPKVDQQDWNPKNELARVARNDRVDAETPGVQ